MPFSKTKKISQWITLVERPIELEDNTSYQLVTVRRGFAGVESRGIFRGKEIKVKNYFVVHAGDFLISKRQIAHGACGIVPESLDGAVVSNEYSVFVPQKETNIEFFFLIMQLPYYKRLFYLMSDGVHIEKLLFKTNDWMKRSLSLPLLPEQQKIAAILSTQDKVIELKEKLLVQKQQQKKYLMQQLLTGKKRLSGFNEKWKVEKFSEIFDFLSTNTLSRDNLFEGVGAIQNIHYGDILTKFNEVIDLDCVCLPSIKDSAIPNKCATVKSGDIIIADTAEDLTVGKVVEVQNIGDRVIYSGLHTMLCRPKEQLFSDGWLGFYMNSEAYHKQLIPYIAGVKVMAISKSNIVKTYIAIPSKAEQTAIAEILGTADHEIDLLQKSIEAEKQKKKALMQLLLTGKVSVRI